MLGRVRGELLICAENQQFVTHRPMRCVIALSSLLVQAQMLSAAMDHEDVLRARAGWRRQLSRDA